MARTQTRRRALCALPALLAPLGAGASSGGAAASLRAIVEGTIHPLMARHELPGMAVALGVDGESFVFNFGVASLETRAPVTDATIFEIGSVSKMFTATLAALAHHTGRLSLDHAPGRYLPRLKGRPIDRATLLHLGTYTAGGLPLQFPDEVHDDEAALAYFRAWTATARPGVMRLYSNPSLALLGAITARALDGDFATLVQERLLPGFGLRSTFVDVPPQAMPHYAWGHRGDRQVRVTPGPMAAPTYGIKTTAADLIRFVQAQMDPRRLEPPLRLAVEETQIGRYRVGGMVQGFGWEQFPYPLSRELLLGGNAAEVILEANPVQPVPAPGTRTPRLFGKTGSTGGFGAYVAFVPARRVGLVMLANRSCPIPARVEAAYAILQQLAPGGR